MTTDHIKEKLARLRDALEADRALEVVNFNIVVVPTGVSDYAALFDDGDLTPGLAAFYRQFDGFNLRWKHRSNPAVSGSAHFLSLEAMVPFWDGYHSLGSGDPDNPELGKGFYPIDYFNEEACVGAFKTKGNSSLYFYNFHGAPQNLGIGIDGYFELLCYARAYRYWQYLILEILSGEESSMGNALREGNRLLRGSFSMKEFIALYNRHRIH